MRARVGKGHILVNRESSLGISEFIIAMLSVEPNGIDGKTVLQKLGYFTSVKMKEEMGYGPDFHGPFSPSVAASLDNLIGLDFVIERGRRTFKGRTMYSYSLTDDGKELAREIKKKHSDEYKIISNVIKKCGKKAHFNYNILSWAAKLHFILKRNERKMTYKEAKKIGPWQTFIYGWKLNEEEKESGIKLLLALGLLERN